MRIQQSIKDNHIPNTEVNYSEKDKKCLIEDLNVSDLFTFLKIKKMLNEEASRMRNKLFNSMGQGPLSLFNLMNYLRSNKVHLIIYLIILLLLFHLCLLL